MRAGLREARLLSFASGGDLELFGDTDAVAVANPLQADEGFLRTGCIPGLFRTPRRAIRRAAGGGVPCSKRARSSARATPSQERTAVAFVLRGFRPARAGHRRIALRRPRREGPARGAARRARRRARGRSAVRPKARSSRGGPPRYTCGRALARACSGSCIPRAAARLDLDGPGRGRPSSTIAVVAGSHRRRSSRSARCPGSPRPSRPGVRDARGRARRLRPGAPSRARRDVAGGVSTVRRLPGAPLARGTKSLAFALDLRAPDRTLTGEDPTRSSSASWRGCGRTSAGAPSR